MLLVARFPLPYSLITSTDYIALQMTIHYEIPFVKEYIARFPFP